MKIVPILLHFVAIYGVLVLANKVNVALKEPQTVTEFTSNLAKPGPNHIHLIAKRTAFGTNQVVENGEESKKLNMHLRWYF